MGEDEVAELIERVLSGEHGTFAKLVDEFQWNVRAFVHSRIPIDADAEDVAQETFIAAFRGLAQFRAGEDFRAWLVGIARHRVQMHYRTKGRREAAQDQFRSEMLNVIQSEMHSVESHWTRVSISRLEDCIEGLPERARRVIRSRLRGCSGDEIAASLNCSVNAIYMIQMRAIESLRKCLTQVES